MAPLSLMVKPVSGACNLRCTYCFYVDEMANRTGGTHARMDEETAKLVIRRAMTYADDGVSFVFQGGEPTLAGAPFYRAWQKEVARHNRRNLTVQYALQTNGYALDDDMLSVLKEGNFLVGVSVDGLPGIHDSRRVTTTGAGTHAQVERNLGKLRQWGIPYNILCVVDNVVAVRGREVYQALRRHGYLQFIPCLEALGSQEPQHLDPLQCGRFLVAVFDAYAQDLRAGRYVSVNLFDNWIRMLNGMPPASCSMMGQCLPNLLVESEGQVYPCDFYGLDEWQLGNLKEQSLFAMMQGPRLKAFLDSSLKRAAPCEGCAWLYLCRGGCRRDRQRGIEDAPGLNRLCQGYQHFFEARMDAMQALSRIQVNTLPTQT